MIWPLYHHNIQCKNSITQKVHAFLVDLGKKTEHFTEGAACSKIFRYPTSSWCKTFIIHFRLLPIHLWTQNPREMLFWQGCNAEDAENVAELHLGLRMGGPDYLMSLGTPPEDLVAWPCSPGGNGGAGRGPGGHNWVRRSHGRLRELWWKNRLMASAFCFGWCVHEWNKAELYSCSNVSIQTKHTTRRTPIWSSMLQHRLWLKHYKLQH